MNLLSLVGIPHARDMAGESHVLQLLEACSCPSLEPGNANGSGDRDCSEFGSVDELSDRAWGVLGQDATHEAGGTRR